MTTARWDHSNTLQLDNSGKKAAGAKAYFYNAGTSTPLVVYQDSLATTPHENPVLADANGRFPAIYIPYGPFKEIVTDKNGAGLWSNDNIPNVDPATGSGGGGGGGSFATGDIKWRYDNTPETGWVRQNGNSIGSGSSGATERANDDTEALFLHLWEKLANSQAPVSGGRGASAAADWAANKTLTLPNLQERGFIGVRGMGGTATALLESSAFANVAILGATGGAGAVTLSASQIPAHAHTGTVTISDPGHFHTIGDPGHSHAISDPGHAHAGGGTGSYANAGGANSPVSGPISILGTTSTNLTGVTVLSSSTNITISPATTGVTASLSVNNAGGGLSHDNVPPGITAVCYIKL